MGKIILLLLFPLSLFGQTRSKEALKHFKLGELLFQNREWTSAIFQFDTCISYHPIYFEAYYSRAIAKERIGDDHGAISDYGAMIELDPTFTESYWNRALLYDKIAYYDLAMEDLHILLEIPEDETNAIFFQARYPDEGISGVATLETMRGKIYNQLGLIAHKKGMYDLAISYYSQAYELSKTSDILVNRSLTYQALNQPGFALNDLYLAKQLEPENTLVLYNLARMEELNGSDAQDTYSEIIKQQPNFSEAYAKRGISKLKAGDLHGAKSDYDSAIIYSPSDALVWKNRGIIQYRLQNYHAAYSDLSKSITLNSQLEESYFYLGNVQMQLEQYTKAVANYDYSLRLDPNQPNAYYNRGIAKHRLNRTMEACADMQKAVDFGRKGAADTFRKMCK